MWIGVNIFKITRINNSSVNHLHPYNDQELKFNYQMRTWLNNNNMRVNRLDTVCHMKPKAPLSLRPDLPDPNTGHVSV